MRRAIYRSGAAATIASLVLSVSCDENLPSGPAQFTGARLTIQVPSDTLVVGTTRAASAITTDADGHRIALLQYSWASADSAILAVRRPAGTAADSSGRSMVFAGKKPGRTTVTLTLPDARFQTAAVTRNETVVVGGVRILSTRDTTLTSINDVGTAISTSLVRISDADPTLVNRASQGIKWTHLGNHVSVDATQGDTVKYTSRSNGVDTLIASHDLCLLGAKCADTVITRVSQQLTLGLSARAFQAFSFSDSVGPTIVLADRGGTGQANTSIRFIPLTFADSVVVGVVGPFGTSNPATGAMAAPRVVTRGNGTARVQVQGIAPDGFTIVSTDQFTVTVRQVARRIQVEALRAVVSVIDSIPVKAVARDARGAPIADATLTMTSVGIPLNGVWAGPTGNTGSPQGTLIPDLTGVALPANNPQAPQIPVTVDAAVFSIVKTDTVKAGTTTGTIAVKVLDSTAQNAVGAWVRFRVSAAAPAPDSVQVDQSGFATVVWSPPNLAGPYTITGLRGLPTAMNTLVDSLGRIVIRHTVEVVADVPSETQSTAAVSAVSIVNTTGTATVTVTLKDRFGNIAKTATAATFAATPSAGTLGAFTCNQGVCQATYTAPAAPGNVTISIKINGVEILFSPIAITIT